MRRYEPENLSVLERSLAGITIDGINIAPVINDFCVTQLLNGNYQQTIWQDVRRLTGISVRLLKQLIPSKRRRKKPERDECSCDLLMTWIKDKKHLNNLVIPVVNNLSELDVTVISIQDKQGDRRLADREILKFSDITKKYHTARFSTIVSAIAKWNKVIKEFSRTTELSLSIRFSLLEVLITGACRALAMKQFLIFCSPGCIVTEYDRNAHTAPLIVAAKSLGIPTATFVHGVINSSYGFTPLVADTIFAWGDKVRDRLIEFGTMPDRIEMTGYSCIDFSDRVDSVVARNKYGLSQCNGIVELATNPVGVTDRLKMVKIFCDAIESLDHVDGIIRLHPSESLEFYDPLINQYPTVKFTTNNEMPVSDAIAVADVVVCHNSGYALEAMSRQTPVIVFDVIDHPLRSAKDYVRFGGCPCVQSGVELKQVVLKIIKDSDFRKKLCNSAEKYTESMYRCTGNDSVNVVSNFIRSVI